MAEGINVSLNMKEDLYVAVLRAIVNIEGAMVTYITELINGISNVKGCKDVVRANGGEVVGEECVCKIVEP